MRRRLQPQMLRCSDVVSEVCAVTERAVSQSVRVSEIVGCGAEMGYSDGSLDVRFFLISP